MCDPFSMMLVAGAAQAGGKLYEGARSAQAQEQGAELADANADLLTKQAQIREGNADLAVTRGNYDEFLSRRKVSHVLAGQTAHAASSNVDVTYGSPLVLQGFTAAQGETEAQLIRARMMVERADELTGVSRIYGEAAGQRGRAEALKAGAKTAMVAGVIGAGTSMLSAGSKWTSLGGGGAPGARSTIGGDGYSGATG